MARAVRLCMAGAALALCLAPAGCAPRRPKIEVWPCMSVYAALSVAPAESVRLPHYVASVKPVTHELETALTIYNPDSELSRFNRGAGGGAVALSGHALRVLQLAHHYAELSGGAFDATVAPLVLMWGFSGGKAPAVLPTEEAIAGVRERTGYRKLDISNSTARLTAPGMTVDLGGIAKGYAVDACYEKLVALGATNFMIDIAGNLRCSGKAVPDRPWTIAVRNPFDAQHHLGTIRLSDGEAAASSGNYERFVTIGNRRYSHIIDPRTGWPVVGMAGTTVICTNATEADAMSTAVFVLGPDGARAVLQKLSSCHALLVPDRQPLRILVTPGFRAHFTVSPAFASCLEEIRPAP